MTGALPVVAEVVRNGFVESIHHGSVVALAPDGAVLWSVGDVDSPMYPRSSSKPLQVVGMLRVGLGDVLAGDAELLAVAAASHDGSPYHVALVERMLALADLDASALENTPTLPYSEAAAREVLRSGGGPSSLLQNCSGKHAAMLVTAAHNGWPIAGYRALEHPVQQAIRTAVADLTGEPALHVAVDGCGAPLLSASLVGLARAFRSLVTAAEGTPERLIADAMRAFPQAVGGPDRAVTQVMQRVPGLLAKDGAEGVYGAALADGTAVTLKIADGAARAAVPVLLEALRCVGVPAESLSGVPVVPVLGAGHPVGEIRALPL